MSGLSSDHVIELVVHGCEIGGVLIVLVRTFLGFSPEVELEGTLPWRRAAWDDRSRRASDA